MQLERVMRVVDEGTATAAQADVGRLGVHDIVGCSASLARVVRLAETVAATDATVLIRGETGTGKELIAGLIHRLSARHKGPLLKFNCTAVPPGLLDSELFGHERGAFTGAITRRVGRFEAANKGTLLLDEIGDLPIDLQPKLLRVLEEQEFSRLGSTHEIRCDVRVVAATNRPLEQLVQQGQFRSDLYYRLNVFPIDLPPLRERVSDIPLLVRHFVAHHARKLGRRIDEIPTEVMDTLTRHSWPGNIRELQHVIQRAVILSRGGTLDLTPLQPLLPQQRAAAAASFDDAIREHILEVLRETDGVVGGPRGAAARLGLKRSTLLSKMEKLGISPADAAAAASSDTVVQSRGSIAV